MQVAVHTLDDAVAIEAADPSAMLRAVASSGAQVRESARLSHEAGLEALRVDGRPRAVVVAGMGGSGIAGHVLQAVAGPECPIPVERVRGWSLPAWVGPLDLVISVSCSGSTGETLACFDQARRRGSRLLVVAQPDSPLARAAEMARAPFVPVATWGRMPRASIWALSVPLLVAASELGILNLPRQMLEETASLLEEIAVACRPDSDAFVNPAKILAVELAGSLPLLWGTSDLAGIAAYRFLCQLAENAKYPAVNGVLPEALHNQIVTFDGPWAGGSAGSDPFHDPEHHGPVDPRMRLVMMRDSDEHPKVIEARVAAYAVAATRGIPVSEVAATAGSPLVRLASLVGLTDFASVYLAIAMGIDPTPIGPIAEVKSQMRL